MHTYLQTYRIISHKIHDEFIYLYAYRKTVNVEQCSRSVTVIYVYKIFISFVLELYSFLASQIFTKFEKIVNFINICILPCKIQILYLYFTRHVLEKLKHFRSRIFLLNFRKLLILSIFIFCLVNWIYVPRGIEQKVRILSI